MASPQRSTPSTPSTISINLWGSHPDDGNDDCWTGIDMPSLEAARAWCASPTPPAHRRQLAADLANTAYFVVVENADDTGLGGIVHAVVRHDAFFAPAAVRRRKREQEREDAEWRREHATQAGMGFGAAGYNDAMGY